MTSFFNQLKKAVSLIYFSLFLLVGNLSCIDQIDIEVEESEIYNPVIDGYITNEVKSHILSISFSQKFSNESDPSVSGASVVIFDDQGGSQPFIEIENGIYASNSNYSAIPGVNYTLEVTMPDGERYRSNPQTCPSKISSNETYYEPSFESFIDFDNQIRNDFGIKFFTNIEENNVSESYYKFEIFPTWIYEAPRAFNETVRFCYVTDENSTFSILRNTIGKTEHPITFFPYSDKFEYGISFNIVQLSMTKEAYEFWDKINIQGQYNGSIFDVPPFSIRGNMINVSGGGRNMLGYFGVYSIAESRLFSSKAILNYDFAYDRAECYPPRRAPRAMCRICTEYPGEVQLNKPDYWPE